MITTLKRTCWHHATATGVLLVSFALSGCDLNPIDRLGKESVQRRDLVARTDFDPVDDRIDDKHPTYRPDAFSEEMFDGCSFELNKSAAVTALDVQPLGPDEADALGGRFRSPSAALSALARRKAAVIPSVELVQHAMKPFNDGLYASIELWTQHGSEDLIGKRTVLLRLLAQLERLYREAAETERQTIATALTYLASGLLLGGGVLPQNLPANIQADAEHEAEAFQHVSASQPVGFYSWSIELQQIFRQDRYLQRDRLLSDVGQGPNHRGDIGIFAAVALALRQDAELRAAYERLLTLYGGLANPSTSYTPLALLPVVDDLSTRGRLAEIEAEFWGSREMPYVCQGNAFAFFPGARAPDRDLISAEFCFARPTIDLLDFVTSAARSGKLDLELNDDSGWYDYQLHTLETLLLPERDLAHDHLLLTARYKQRLVESFKSILVQTRETHIKQVNPTKASVRMPTPERDLYPLLPLEPAVSFYLRSARAYRFVDAYLRGVLGDKVLETRGRVLDDGRTLNERSLAAELADKVRLLYGLFLVSARSVGFDPDAALLQDELATYPPQQSIEAAHRWLADWSSNPSLSADSRVIVPTFVGRDETLYSATLGVKIVKLRAAFVEGHEPRLSSEQHGCTLGQWVRHDYYLLLDQTEQLALPRSVPAPTSEQFRRALDAHDELDAVTKALSEQASVPGGA